MRVVVTGASGYIGKRLTASLSQRGATVVGLSRHEGAYRCILSGATGSLDDHMHGASHVVHLAARLVDDPRAGVSDYYAANVAFTEQVLRAAAGSNVTSFVHASTRLVYPGTLTRPAREHEDVLPDTPYGISKKWAEDLVRYLADMNGMSAVSLRIAQVTGGSHAGLGVINSFVSQARKRNEIVVNGSGAAIREFVHVDDVVDAFVAALTYQGRWTPVNVGGTRALSIKEIAQHVANLCGDRVAVTHAEVESEDRSSYALSGDHAWRVLGWKALWTPEEIIAAAYTD